MPDTRKERIDFIRENAPKYRDHDFHDYDDSDILTLYLRIPLPPDKQKKSDMEGGIGMYVWGKFGEWLIRDNQPSWLRGFLIVMWIMVNPLCLILYISIAVFWLAFLGHN